MTIRRIGFIGVGHIGGAMARAMVRAGYDVMAYDLRSERLAELASDGVRVGESLVELAAHAELLSVAIAGAGKPLVMPNDQRLLRTRDSLNTHDTK